MFQIREFLMQLTQNRLKFTAFGFFNLKNSFIKKVQIINIIFIFILVKR